MWSMRFIVVPSMNSRTVPTILYRTTCCFVVLRHAFETHTIYASHTLFETLALKY
jgi:hypothetical protein